MTSTIDNARTILQQAATSGRFSLLEHEVYEVLQAAGCPIPRHHFLRASESVTPQVIEELKSRQVVLKVMSPEIAHKTDVGGVKIVDASSEAITQAIASMRDNIPLAFAAWIASHPELCPTHLQGLSNDQVAQHVSQSIVGFLLVEEVEIENEGPGSELLVSLRNNREFGPVLTLGIGGVDTELWGEVSKPSQAVVSCSASLLTSKQVLQVFSSTVAYRRLTGKTRAHKPLVSETVLQQVFDAFLQLATHFGPTSTSEWVIQELEVNPFAASRGGLVALDGILSFGPQSTSAQLRPQASIRALLEPSSIAVIGASAKGMNMGRIILGNIVEAGFDKSKLYVVRPGLEELDGVKCVPTVSDLPERVDAFVLAVGAEQAAGVIEELAASDKAVGVILIAGGMGEKEGGAALESRVKGAIRTARNHNKPLVVNGGNSLGIVSRPGKYHTLFIPQSKLPLRTDGASNMAFISQSGAYMITRMSKLAWMSPRYAMSLGNQVDLTISDYLSYLTEDTALQTLAVYVEGFNDLDGLVFSKAVKRATSAGKDVIFYKAGRTAEGKTATSGHTASLAGEYDVCASIVRDAGAHVAKTFSDFLNLTKISSLLGHKNWQGNRLAAMSNAGYETVGIADSVRGSGWNLSLAKLQTTTRDSLQKALADNQLDSLVDVRNPMDITPMASDQAHEDVLRALCNDSNVDLVLCASVPLTPAMATLDGPEVAEAQSIRSAGSLPHRMGRVATDTSKPLVACIDSGTIFDAMAQVIESQGVPTFRTADEAVRSIGLYLEGRRLRMR